MRCSALLPLLLASAACPVPGERALDGCPSGEHTSPATPDGLGFSGLLTRDDLWLADGLHPTAVGGRQSVWLSYGRSSVRFDGDYVPETDVAGITATRDGAIVQLAATAPDQGYLRINALDGTLYDRIRIGSAAAVRLELRAVGERVEAGRTLAVTPGPPTTVLVAMLTADGGRVVDDSLAIEAPVRSSWDGVLIEPTSTPVTVRAISGAGLTGRWVVRTATAVDAVVLQAPGRLPLGTWTLVCATARSGDDQLLGQAWQFEAEPGDALLRSPSKAYRNCIDVAPQRSGAVPLTATAGARTAVMMLDVGTSAAQTARPALAGGDLTDRGVESDRLRTAGIDLLQRGEASAAVAKFEAALGLRPDDAEALAGLAWALWHREERTPEAADLARAHLGRALRLAPSFLKALLE